MSSKWGLRAQHAPAVAVNGHHWNFVQAEASGLGKFDDVFAQRIQVIAAGVDDTHLFHLLFAEIVQRTGGVLVDSDLGEGAAGHGVVGLAPSPDLWGVHMHEIGSTSQGTFFSQVAGSSGGRVVNKNGAVAVSKAADEGATGIFVDVGADAVYVLT